MDYIKKASSDPTSDIDIVSFSFSIYIVRKIFLGERGEYADQGKELTTKEAKNVDNNGLKEPPKNPD